MKNLFRLVVGIAIPAFIMVGGMASSAIAQDKASKATASRKVLIENEKVRVFEVTQKPGEENVGVANTAFRVVRVLNGAKTERTHADGKKEIKTWKTGEVEWQGPSPAYTTKNVDTSTLLLYVIQLK